MKLVPLVLATVMSTGAAPGASVSAVGSGYWWAGASGITAAPAPPSVPDGGLYVASSPSGATAVSAVRFTLPADQANPQLVLKVHQLEKGDSFAVDAYPTSSKWSPGSAQAWSSQPVPAAHAVPVHGVVSADGTTVTFSLTDVVPGGRADVVLVPGAAVAPAAGAPAPPSPTFDASFERVTASSVLSTQLQQPAAGGPDTQYAAPPIAGPVAGPVAAAAAPALGAPLVPSARNAAPQPAVAPTANPQPLTSPQLPAAALTRPVGRSSRDTALLVVLLGGTMFYLGWLGRSQTVGASGRVSLYDLPPPVDETA